MGGPVQAGAPAQSGLEGLAAARGVWASPVASTLGAAPPGPAATVGGTPSAQPMDPMSGVHPSTSAHQLSCYWSWQAPPLGPAHAMLHEDSSLVQRQGG